MSRKKDSLFKTRRYTRKTVHRDREYGFFWYDWIWKIARAMLVFLCALLVVAGVALTAWEKIYGSMFAPADPKDATSYPFTIRSGETATAIGRNLENEGLISSASVFKYYVQFYGLTNKLQSGVYYISKNQDVFDIAKALTGGNATNERTIRVIPGWTCEDIADYLVSVGALDDREQFLKECRGYSAYLGSSLALQNADEDGSLKSRTYPLDGYLAPDTYRVYLTATPSSIIRTLLQQSDNVYNQVFDHENEYDENGNLTRKAQPYGAKGVQLNEDQVYILASVLEKEAASYEDMRKVAAVFYNRLALGMRLESDATVNYLTGNTNLVLTQAQLARRTAYNTYVVDGLPAGPICNPGKNALNAALNPDSAYLDANYLYFCAAEPGTGRIVYSLTAEEHEANVAIYRPLWEAYDEQNRLLREQGR